jgi:hypothetical protein
MNEDFKIRSLFSTRRLRRVSVAGVRVSSQCALCPHASLTFYDEETSPEVALTNRIMERPTRYLRLPATENYPITKI